MKQHIYSSREEMIEDGVKDVPEDKYFAKDMIRRNKKEFPYCDKRVDTRDIEDKMRGVKEEECRKICKTLYDECVSKLERVLYVVKEMRDGLCAEKDDEQL